MQALSWHAAIVDRLIELRAEGPGWDFESHWRIATRENPPKGLTQGEATPRLFDETGERAETQLMFFKHACERAYYREVGPEGSGQGPKLAFWRPELLEELDLTDQHAGIARQAA